VKSDYPDMKVGTIRDLKSIIGLNAYWRDIREDYSGDDLIYKGMNYFHDAAVSDDNWEIWKYTYEDGVRVREEGPLPGAWSGRGKLSWSDDSPPAVSKTPDADRAYSLMEEVLAQLKIMNFHLQILTDEEIECKEELL